MFPNQVFQFFIFRMNCNCLVSEQGFWARCCDFNRATVNQLIIEIVEFSLFVAGFNL